VSQSFEIANTQIINNIFNQTQANITAGFLRNNDFQDLGIDLFLFNTFTHFLNTPIFSIFKNKPKNLELIEIMMNSKWFTTSVWFQELDCEIIEKKLEYMIFWTIFLKSEIISKLIQTIDCSIYNIQHFNCQRVPLPSSSLKTPQQPQSTPSPLSSPQAPNFESHCTFICKQFETIKHNLLTYKDYLLNDFKTHLTKMETEQMDESATTSATPLNQKVLVLSDAKLFCNHVSKGPYWCDHTAIPILKIDSRFFVFDKSHFENGKLIKIGVEKNQTGFILTNLTDLIWEMYCKLVKDSFENETRLIQVYGESEREGYGKSNGQIQKQKKGKQKDSISDNFFFDSKLNSHESKYLVYDGGWMNSMVQLIYGQSDLVSSTLDKQILISEIIEKNPFMFQNVIERISKSKNGSLIATNNILLSIKSNTLETVDQINCEDLKKCLFLQSLTMNFLTSKSNQSNDFFPFRQIGFKTQHFKQLIYNELNVGEFEKDKNKNDASSRTFFCNYETAVIFHRLGVDIPQRVIVKRRIEKKEETELFKSILMGWLSKNQTKENK